MLLPSPGGMAEKIAAALPLAGMAKIVEVGSGTGRLTMAIHKKMSPGAKLICVEKNPAFCQFLQDRFPQTSVRVLNVPAEDLLKLHPEVALPPADCVVLSLPASLVPEETRRVWVRMTEALLKPHGYLLIHQFIPKIKKHLSGARWQKQKGHWLMGLPPYYFEIYRKKLQ